MSDHKDTADATAESDEKPPMEAARYPDGSILYPARATVITWTTSTATPPGVREPNHLAIVEFDVDGESVRAIGQLTTDGVEIGDTVEPVYAEELRDPEAGIREPASQSWDGYRFRPIE